MKMYNESTGRHVQLEFHLLVFGRSGDGKVTYDVNGNAITSAQIPEQHLNIMVVIYSRIL